MELIRLNKDNLLDAVRLASELHRLATFNESGPAFNWEYTRAMMAHVMHDPNYYFMLARDETGYVGAVCGKIVTFYFSPEFMGIEDAWYVRDGTPGRASVGRQLMDSFVDWCFERGALFVQSGDVAGIRTVGVDALYRHMGFTRFGTIYKYVRG